MIPTRRLAAAVLAAALLALVLPWGIAVAACVGLVAAGVVDALLARHVGPVVETIPATVARAARTPVAVALRDPFAGSVALRLPAPPDIRVEPAVADGALDGTLTAARRGRHAIGPVALRATGPLGLGAWQHRRGEERALVVYPDLPGARRIAAAVRAGRLPDGTRRRGAIGLGTEFELVRDYSPDDDVRQVNWRATARVGRPMSNQYRIEQDRDVLLLLDAGRLLRAPAGGGATLLDCAIDAACAVAAVTEAVGDRVGTIAFDARILREARPRRRGAALVAHALHDVEPSDVESDYERAFALAARRQRCLLLLFADLFEESASRPLVASLPLLARRHAVIVVAAADPYLAATIATPPERVEDVLRASIATEALEARRRVETLLAARGVAIVQARPEQLPAAAVRAYLRQKARARL